MAETRLNRKNERSGGPAGMMNPWISTSLPLYDLIAWVTSKFARIESTSWANVSRGVSAPWARSPGHTDTAQSVSARAGYDPRCHRPLRERRKVLRDLRPVGAHGGKQPRQRPQQDDGAEHHRLQRADG